MRTVKITEVKTTRFNILNRLYKLTKNGDTKVSKYFNSNFVPLSINNINYTNNPIGA